MGFFSNEEFIRYKKCTQPVYQTPASIQQMLDIAGVHENGIFEIEPNNGAGKKRRKFDRVYSFSDLNYVDQDKQQNGAEDCHLILLDPAPDAFPVADARTDDLIGIQFGTIDRGKF